MNAPNTAIQQRPQGKDIRSLIEAAKPKLAEVLPKHLSADRMVRVSIACIVKTPALAKCTSTSLLNCLMTAAQLGLEPTGVLGGAYLVPFKDECTLVIGYRGLIDLARRSGQIESIEAHVVHSRDRFTCHYGLDPRLEHEPAWTGDRGDILAVYAVAKLVGGGRQVEVMTRGEVDAIRARSKSGNSGPWATDYSEMARKTVVRRLCKYLPLSVEMADALAAEEETALAAAVDVTPAKSGGVAALKSITIETAPTPVEPPHDPATGEVDDEDQLAREAREMEAAEARQ
jgi:recombination protein RecT